jgi:hypothetical protein
LLTDSPCLGSDAEVLSLSKIDECFGDLALIEIATYEKSLYEDYSVLRYKGLTLSAEETAGSRQRIVQLKSSTVGIDEGLDCHQRATDDLPTDRVGARNQAFLLIDHHRFEVLA